jgi:IS5 family transposase
MLHEFLERLTEIFCELDDLAQELEVASRGRELSGKKAGRGGRKATMHPSEVATILLLFQVSAYRDVKHFYQEYVCEHLVDAFPGLVRYPRFVELEKRALLLLCALLRRRLGRCTGVSYVDSTPLPVCHVRRGGRNRVFGALARFSKTTSGWFFGFKLHLVVSDRGALLGFALTPANVDDRNRDVMARLTERVFGKLVGDKGYIDASLFWELYDADIELITSIRKNMKNKLSLLENRYAYRARGLVESVNHVLKDVLHAQHTRHRSPLNFLANLMAALCAYQLRPRKPTAAVWGLA